MLSRNNVPIAGERLAAGLSAVDRFFGGFALALLLAVVVLLMLNGPRAKGAEPLPPATKAACAKSECPKECEARARAAFAFAKEKESAKSPAPAAAPMPRAVEKKTGSRCPCESCECGAGKPCSCGPRCSCPACAGKAAAKPAKPAEPETELWLINGQLWRVPKGSGPPACAGPSCVGSR